MRQSPPGRRSYDPKHRDEEIGRPSPSLRRGIFFTRGFSSRRASFANFISPGVRVRPPPSHLGADGFTLGRITVLHRTEGVTQGAQLSRPPTSGGLPPFPPSAFLSSIRTRARVSLRARADGVGRHRTQRGGSRLAPQCHCAARREDSIAGGVGILLQAGDMSAHGTAQQSPISPPGPEDKSSPAKRKGEDAGGAQTRAKRNRYISIAWYV